MIDPERIFRTHYATDIVRGQIIGGDHLDCLLVYQGRPQGQRFAADSVEDAKAKAEQQLAAIKAECGHAYEMIYRDPNAWHVRIRE